MARILSFVFERDANQLDFFLGGAFFAVFFFGVVVLPVVLPAVLGFADDRVLVGALATAFGLGVRCVVIFFFEAVFGFFV